MNQVFQFVEQLLGASDAEGGDDDGAFVFQGVLDGGLEFQAAVLAAFMDAVAVGAFNNEGVGFVRGLGGRQ